MRPGRRVAPSWVRSVLLVALLGLLTSETPAPWGTLWLAVPAAVALSLLAGWRFGVRGVVVPIALLATVIAVAGPFEVWAWWIPAASLTGLWMGLREEGGGPALGDRAWMLVPLLLLAAVMPWDPHYAGLVDRTQRELTSGDQQILDLSRQVGTPAPRLKLLEQTLGEQARLRAEALPRAIPTLVFLWMALLVMAGRTIGSRISGTLKWPPLSRSPLVRWRLPDAAIWVFLSGLGLLVVQRGAWAPTGWTLLLNAALGFGVQGIAVVESVLLARGVPPSIIVLTLVFVSTFALPVFLIAAVAVGLGDVWLDFRRLEAAKAEGA